MLHIVIKEREDDTPDVHVYGTPEEAIEEVRYAKMMQKHINFTSIRLFEAIELDVEGIPPMTREEIAKGE